MVICKSKGRRAKHDCSGNRDHFNLIFPVHLKLMTVFPSVYLEMSGTGFDIRSGFG